MRDNLLTAGPRLNTLRTLIRSLERSLARALEERDCCPGLSMAQCQLLLELQDTGHCSVNSLSARLKLDKSTLSRTIDQLVRPGLAKREQDPADRRGLLISLTPAGIKTVGRISTCWDAFYADLFKRVPAEKHGALVDALSLLAEAFDTKEISKCQCRLPQSMKMKGADQ